MIFKKNEGAIDRWIRLFAAEALFLAGLFWFGGWVQIVLLVAAAVLLLTAALGFCGPYALLGWNTCALPSKPLSVLTKSILILISVAILIGGTYTSMFFTKKIFLEDYNSMNHYYKQALFFTGQEKRDEAVTNYAQLVTAYGAFRSKYTTYRPYVLFGDGAFLSDLDTINGLISVPKEKIQSGDLKAAHLDLERVRPMFQDILKRDGFSMLAVSLVDFHDAMETVITPADAHDAAGVLAAYANADEKLRAVEEAANDTEIQAIRANLESVKALAEQGNVQALPAKAAELKSSFIKVYLVRG